MREIYGDKVKLRAVPHERGFLQLRSRKLPSVLAGDAPSFGGLAIGDDLVSAIEARALWARYGL